MGKKKQSIPSYMISTIDPTAITIYDRIKVQPNVNIILGITLSLLDRYKFTGGFLFINEVKPKIKEAFDKVDKVFSENGLENHFSDDFLSIDKMKDEFFDIEKCLELSKDCIPKNGSFYEVSPEDSKCVNRSYMYLLSLISYYSGDSILGKLAKKCNMIYTINMRICNDLDSEAFRYRESQSFYNLIQSIRHFDANGREFFIVHELARALGYDTEKHFSDHFCKNVISKTIMMMQDLGLVDEILPTPIEGKYDSELDIPTIYTGVSNRKQMNILVHNTPYLVEQRVDMIYPPSLTKGDTVPTESVDDVSPPLRGGDVV